MSASGSVGPSPRTSADGRTWKTVYPVYINSKVSREEGRRISKKKGVENPTAAEIAEVLERLGMEPVLQERKQHPRTWNTPGRVRFHLTKADGTLAHAEATNKTKLLVLLAKLIPRLRELKEQQNKAPAGKGGKNKGGKKRR